MIDPDAKEIEAAQAAGGRMWEVFSTEGQGDLVRQIPTGTMKRAILAGINGYHEKLSELADKAQQEPSKRAPF